MRKTMWLVSLLVAVPLAAVAQQIDEPLPVVAHLDTEQLWGKYYVIGTYLQSIEEGCSNSAITFAPREAESDAATLTVECDHGWFHPKIDGVAQAIEPGVLTRTRATFKPPFGDEYREEFHIIMVDDAYSWLVIGHPRRHLLWVLSRDPSLPTDQLSSILDRVGSDFGYNEVRQKLTCVTHDDVPAEQCTDALWQQGWLDYLSAR